MDLRPLWTLLLIVGATLPLAGCRGTGPGYPPSSGAGTGSGNFFGTTPGSPGTGGGNPFGMTTRGIGTRPGGSPAAPVNSDFTSPPPSTSSPTQRPSPFTTGSNAPVQLTQTDDDGGWTQGAAGGTTSTEVDLRTGGGNLEQTAYSWAYRAVQPSTNDPTVLRHEAVHWINGELGGNPDWQDLNPRVSRAFYIWGTNQYYVVPNTGIRKIDVLDLVPTHLTSSHDNYFYNFDFGSRDALHILEDFSAEIGSGEKSSLLFDMLVFSAALGLKLEQLQASGRHDYWRTRRGALFRGTVKAFMERAAPGLEGRLQALAFDRDPRSKALRDFLERTYGQTWSRNLLRA